MPTDAIVIKLIPSLLSCGKHKYHPEKKKKKNKKKTNKQIKKKSYPLPHAFMEDTIRHNIAQMTSTSKAYIPCLLAIIIK